MPFHCYLDEAHHFQGQTLAEMLSGIGKFMVSLTLSHQYTGQLDRPFRDALLGTVGNLVAFRLSGGDAELLEPELMRQESDPTLPELPAFHALARTDRTYIIETPGPPIPLYPKAAGEIRTRSRRRYARQRKAVEAEIARFIAGT